MQSMQEQKFEGKSTFLVIAIIVVSFGITMSFVVSEFGGPHTDYSTSLGEIYWRITLPMITALIVVLVFVAFGLLYSAQRVTTLY